jgi:superfamily II DNA or RNA helicase
MPEILLSPARHQQPVCASYEDDGAVREFERAMRVHRAFVEPYTVVPTEPRADGAYRVTGGSGGTYVVDIVDASGLHDACTCPDFLGNGLGTCKHVEAVRRALASAPAVRRLARALPAAPATPTVTVHADGRVALHAVGAWPAALTAAHGLQPLGAGNAVAVREGTTLVAGRLESGVRIVHAAVLAAEGLRARERNLRRAGEIRSLIAAGRAGVDVLAKPLFPYQRTGVAYLVEAGRALLADDMGLGKTVQAIAACEVLRGRGEASRVVVVTPASLKHQWAMEIEALAHRQAAVLAGGAQLRREALESDAPYKILSYELTWRELSRLRALDADILILDEAQRAKNFRTKTAATLRALPSRFLFVLTGTPVENRLDDLYSLLQLIDPDVLGPLWKFNFEFHSQNHKGKIVGYKNLGALRERIAPVVLRRRKEEVLSQLPSLTEQTRYTPLTRQQAELEADYRAVAARYMALAEKRALLPAEVKKMQMALLKARQACNALELCDPSGDAASPKLDEFEALIAEVAAQGTSKVLVFSEWVEMLHLAARRLERLGIGYGMLHGSIPVAKRPALLDRFRHDLDQRVLLASDAGGVGLNLQVASYVVHLDLPWNPARLDQRTSRAHRLGQTRGVSVTYLCAEEGIERGIQGTLAGKRAVRSAALDPDSQVEELESPSFTVFLRELRAVLDALTEPGAGAAGEEEGTSMVSAETAAQECLAPAAASPAPTGAFEAPRRAGEAQAPASSGSAPGPAATGGAARAGNRLRLARVVLEAGFPGDAVRAAYDALAAAIASLVSGEATPGHAALVAVTYRDLVPSGRLPTAVPAALARLHDLTTLEAQGVNVDPALAAEAVGEAEAWVQRIVA